MNEYSILVMIGAVLVFVTLILWIFLPFAVFGIKERLDRVIKLLERRPL